MQVRQLQATGFAIRKDILAEVDTANKFYRHGLLLKQVVNFYNNSATEIIPCQKPMLLQVQPNAFKLNITSLYMYCTSQYSHQDYDACNIMMVMITTVHRAHGSYMLGSNQFACLGYSGCLPSGCLLRAHAAAVCAGL